MITMLEERGDAMDAVAARLEAARKALGLSKRDFAEGAGIGEQTYGPYENGSRALTLESAKKLRKTYGITLEFMFYGNKNDLPHRIAAKL